MKKSFLLQYVSHCFHNSFCFVLFSFPVLSTQRAEDKDTKTSISNEHDYNSKPPQQQQQNTASSSSSLTFTTLENPDYDFKKTNSTAVETDNDNQDPLSLSSPNDQQENTSQIVENKPLLVTSVSSNAPIQQSSTFDTAKTLFLGKQQLQRTQHVPNDRLFPKQQHMVRPLMQQKTASTSNSIPASAILYNRSNMFYPSLPPSYYTLPSHQHQFPMPTNHHHPMPSVKFAPYQQNSFLHHQQANTNKMNTSNLDFSSPFATHAHQNIFAQQMASFPPEDPSKQCTKERMRRYFHKVQFS